MLADRQERLFALGYVAPGGQPPAAHREHLAPGDRQSADRREQIAPGGRQSADRREQVAPGGRQWFAWCSRRARAGPSVLCRVIAPHPQMLGCYC